MVVEAIQGRIANDNVPNKESLDRIAAMRLGKEYRRIEIIIASSNPPALDRASFRSLESGRLKVYSTLPAEASRTTLPTTTVSALSGKCEQKPMPT